MTKITRKTIEESFETLKTQQCSELKNINLVYSDVRMGNLVALAKVNESGAFWLKTNYMSFLEMNAFLFGYSACHNKDIK